MTVSLVPRTGEADVYLVLDELSTKDRVWRVVDEELATEATIINWIADVSSIIRSGSSRSTPPKIGRET